MVPNRRLVIVVRADPVICGHSGEARNLAEAARAHELLEADHVGKIMLVTGA